MVHEEVVTEIISSGQVLITQLKSGESRHDVLQCKSEFEYIRYWARAI